MHPQELMDLPYAGMAEKLCQKLGLWDNNRSDGRYSNDPAQCDFCGANQYNLIKGDKMITSEIIFHNTGRVTAICTTCAAICVEVSKEKNE